MFTSDAWVTSALPCGHVTAHATTKPRRCQASGGPAESTPSPKQSIGSPRPPRSVVVLSRDHSNQPTELQSSNQICWRLKATCWMPKPTLSMIYKHSTSSKVDTLFLSIILLSILLYILNGSTTKQNIE